MFFTWYFTSVQGERCIEIITLPIQFLIPLAKYVKTNENGHPDVTIMWNPSRCGSTLLCQLLEPMPNLVAMCEPDFISWDFDNVEQDTKMLLFASLWIQCKQMESKSIVIKPRYTATPYLKYFAGTVSTTTYVNCANITSN